MPSTMIKRAHVAAMVLAAVTSAGAFSSAGAYSEKTLYRFCSQGKTCADGSSPTDVVMDSSGNLFGTTISGPRNDGGSGNGVVFEYKPHGRSYHVLYTFCSLPGCADGAQPYRSKLVIDTNGNLYGTTSKGGVLGQSGVVFELVRKKSGWREKILHRFCSKKNCNDGSQPQAGLTYVGAAAGIPYDGLSPLFGTTGSTAFALAPQSDRSKKWALRTLYNFCSEKKCVDGTDPASTVYADAAGNLFGATFAGGKSGQGVVFELLNNAGAYSETVLYNFCSQSHCVDGGEPLTGVVMDSGGNLFGVADSGGAADFGVLFQLTPQGDGSWQYGVLASFDEPAVPISLIVGKDGDLFGTTNAGGLHNRGTVFQYSHGTLQTIYSVCNKHGCPDGERPTGNLIQDAAGNLIGTTVLGGTRNAGTLFELFADRPLRLAVPSSAIR